MRLAALIPAGFAIGALLCRGLLTHHPQSIDVDLAQPIPVVTYWKIFGLQMFLILLFAVAVASAGYIATLRQISAAFARAPRRALTAIVFFSLLGCVAALAWPAIFSSDVYAYAAYGDLALRGLSPYAHAPPHLHDSLIDAAAWQWSGTFPICVYGPIFVWIAKGAVAAALPFGTAAPLWLLRLLACLALAGCAPLAYAAFGGYSRNLRLAAAAGIALNPIAIWESASGHNDVMAVAAVLAGFAAIRNAHLRTGAAVIALSSLLKAPALAASAGLLAAAWRDRAQFRTLLGATAPALAIAVFASWPLVSAAAVHATNGAGGYNPQFSLQMLLRSFMPIWAVIAVASIFACALGGLGIRRLAIGLPDGGIFLAFAAWLAVPNPYPWYALWILPCAFLAWNTRAGWSVIAATLLIVFRYYPDATFPVLPIASGLAVALLEFAVPILLLTAYIRDRSRRDRREIRTTVLDSAPHRSA